jgi:hypothetical protein
MGSEVIAISMRDIGEYVLERRVVLRHETPNQLSPSAVAMKRTRNSEESNSMHTVCEKMCEVRFRRWVLYLQDALQGGHV